MNAKVYVLAASVADENMVVAMQNRIQSWAKLLRVVT